MVTISPTRTEGATARIVRPTSAVTLPVGSTVSTFASRSRHRSGVGSGLFARTSEAASRLGFAAINATIRVENVGGLAYYSRMGFETYLVEHGDPKAQGRVFNREHKRFTL